MTHTRLVTGIAAAAASILVLAGGADAQRTGSRVLELKVTGTRISAVDVPPLTTKSSSPATPGDAIIARSKISGASTGRRYMTCLVTQTAPSVEAGLYSCQISYVLSGGTIMAAGVFHLTGRKPVAAAITGGTGRYAGARGVVSSRAGTDTMTLQ